jgi:uncharacterized repeat protein (TIGR01451 family)
VTAVPADSVLYWPRHIDTLPAGVRYAGSYRVRGGSLITPPTTGDDGDQETLTWWWNTLENSSSTEPLTFTLSFSAALTGVDLDGNREWDSYYRWKLGMDNESILEWNTKDISGTFGASKEVNRSDDVIQPYLVDLDPVKSLVGGGPVVAGRDLVTYTFTVYNTGRAPAYDVVISDTLPPGMIFDSYQARVYPSSGSDYDPVTSMAPSMGQIDTIGWIFDEIAAGDGNTYDPSTHLVVTYTVRVLSDVGSGASLANSAWISDYSSLPGEQPYERHYDYLSDDGQRYSASPVTVPEAQIRKSADVTQVALGELVVFSITVPDPTLNATLYNAVVTDTLPVPLQVVDAWASGGAIPVVGTDETVTVDYGTLVAGVTATLVITARVPTTATGITGPNVAQVGWDDAAINGTSHTAQSNAVELVLTVPNMNVDKSAPVIVLPGDELIYQITYQNSGLAMAKDVRLTDTLPISLSYTGFDASPPVTALGSLPGPLVWDLGSLPPGGSGTIWLTTTVWSTATLGGILVNEVSIGTTSAGDDLSDNSDTTSTAIGGAVLEITKTAVPDPVLAGDLLHYSMTVRNVGSEATQNLIITDRVPLSTTFINASPSGSLVSDTVQWTPANLGVGEQSVVTFTVRVDSSLVSGTLIINQDYEAGGDNVVPGDPLPPVVVTVYDQRALLTVNKTATPDPVPAGELVHYTLTVRNGGNGIAQNLLVTDRVPLSTTFVSASPGGGLVGDTVEWMPADLPVDDETVVTFTVRVDAPLISGTQIVNRDYGAQAENGASVGSLPPVTVTVDSQPVLSINKTAVSSIDADADLVYTIRYQNIGNAVAHNVHITETYDANVSYVKAVPAPDQGNNVWFIDTLPPGVERTIVVTTHVGSLVSDGTMVINNVAIGCDETSLEEDTASTRIGGYSAYVPLVLKNFAPPQVVNLTVESIKVEPASPVVGQPARMYVTLHNSGNSAVTGDFWVDLYVDPTETPTINVLWNDIAPYGKAWFIHQDIPAGGTLVIHTDQPDDTADPDAVYSNWPGWFVTSGEHQLYVQVDAYGPYGQMTGMIQEEDETDNVAGPVIVTVTASSTRTAPAPPVQWQERR